MAKYGWRARFRWLFFRALIAAGVFLLVGGVLTPWRAEARAGEDWLFLVLDGLVAFCEVCAVVCVGLFAMGWILSPRPPKNGEQ
jgi:Tfp pilus assembly protein PilN